jgi:serine/threonine-protein kinase
MITADLGACEWFVWDLRRSNLVERGQLDQVIGEYLEQHPGAEPAELADYLVGQNILTRFQADNLLAGKNQGLVLGPYTLTDVLGTGSMGTVYRGRSKTDQKWYAVKVLPRRSMWNIRIARRRVRDFEQFQHPAVVPFVDVGTSGGMHYLAWPYVEGEFLDKMVERLGKLSAAQTALIGMQTAEGLDVCHRREIIHGLIKPSNLLVTPEQQVKILDFGVGSLLVETEGESVVDTMSTANTLASGLDCASPESIMDPGNTSAASDQYSLGCVLYYCLTGSFPFPGNNAVEKMMAHQTKEPQPIKELTPDAPDGLISVVERLMQKEPGSRYPSVNDVIAAIRPFALQVAPQVVPAAPPAPPVAATKPAARVAPTAAAAAPQPQIPSTPTPPPARSATPAARPAPPVAPPGPAPRPAAPPAPAARPAAPPAPAARPASPGVPPPPPARPPAAASAAKQQSLRGSMNMQVPPPPLPPGQPGPQLTFPLPSAPPHAPGASARLAPVHLNEEELQKGGADQRFGPIGIAIVAVVSCGLAWLLARFLL